MGLYKYKSEYSELIRLGKELDLSAVWLTRDAMSESIAEHRNGIEIDLPLQRPESRVTGTEKVGRGN